MTNQDYGTQTICAGCLSEESKEGDTPSGASYRVVDQPQCESPRHPDDDQHRDGELTTEPLPFTHPFIADPLCKGCGMDAATECHPQPDGPTPAQVERAAQWGAYGTEQPKPAPVPEPEEDHARDQARAQMGGIAQMVERLDHAQEFENIDSHGNDFETDADDCEIEDADIIEASGYWPNPGQVPDVTIWDKYHDAEDAEQRIHEDALSVQVRDSQWKSPGQAEYGPDQFEILLCTGGPAVRIMGEIDNNNEPDRAWLEYQDWGTPWTEYHGENYNGDALLAYARCFYFGA
ncbi:MAG: hypothetical protein V3S68_06990 [Dehalococcoidia bacterium]